MALIEFQSVSKSFGSSQILKSVSFKIPKGKKTFILGQSGEGKSVIIKHILGLFLPDKGIITFEGETLPQSNPGDTQSFFLWKSIRSQIGCMFQEGALLDSLSVFENIQLALLEHNPGYTTNNQKEIIEKVTQLVHYQGSLHQKAARLSVGEKKRIGLARALALKPKVMIYDEPTTSMDPVISDGLDDLVDFLHQHEGVTSIVISHDIVSMKRLAEHIIFLSGGNILFDGQAEAFFSSPDLIIKQFREGNLKGPLTSEKQEKKDLGYLTI